MRPRKGSEHLRRKISFASAQPEGGLDVWRAGCSADVYPELLFEMHCVIRASVPLMETAAQQCRLRASSDKLCLGLGKYFREHIKDERGHEDWLLEDLEVLGIDRNKVLRRQPRPIVAQLVGSQYYWIQHVHPVALLGYIAVLEGNPPSLEMVNQLIRQTGLPRQAFRTILRHAEEDPGHRQELDGVLDTLPLQPRHFQLVGLSALSTAANLTGLLEQVACEKAAG
jgi:hypothetical protein